MVRKTSHKIKAKMTRMAEEKHIGAEPAEGSEVKNVLEAYNHYNYFYNRADAAEFLESYLRSIGSPLADTKDLLKTPTTLGWIARMKERGVLLPLEANKWFDRNLEALPPKLTVYTNGNFKEENENADMFLTREEKLEKRIEALLARRDVKLNPEFFIGKKFAEDFQTKMRERYAERLTNLVAGDPEIDQIIRDNLRLLIVKFGGKVTKKGVTKAKVVQPKPVVDSAAFKEIELVAKDDVTGIKTLPATKLFDKEMFVLYIPGVRILRTFVAKEGQRLMIEGNKVLNYDPEKSLNRVIRKPELVIPALHGKNKKEFLAELAKVTTAATPTTTPKIAKGNHMILAVY